MAESAFTPEETEKFKTAFATHDKDGSGFIDNAEIWTLIESLGDAATKEQVDTALSTLVMKGDGKIDFDEFIQLMTAVKSA